MKRRNFLGFAFVPFLAKFKSRKNDGYNLLNFNFHNMSAEQITNIILKESAPNFKNYEKSYKTFVMENITNKIHNDFIVGFII